MFTGSADAFAIMATTALESTPPDRNAPSGTSEMSRSRTDSSRRVGELGHAVLGSSARIEREATDPNTRAGSGTGSPRRTVSVWAGGSLRAAAKIVRGSGT